MRIGEGSASFSGEVTFLGRPATRLGGFFIGVAMKKISKGAFVRANLKAAIEDRFGSQIAFARETGFNSVKVSRFCRGWIEPTPDERERIADALRADVDWLFAVVRIPAPRRLSIETAAPGLACAGRE